MVDTRYRQAAGLLLGLALGLIYGGVSQSINLINLPGVPLSQPPFGALGNSAGITLVGGVLGGIAASTFSSYKGVAISTLVGSLLVLAGLFPGGNAAPELILARLLSFGLFLFPIAGVVIIIIGLFRWLLNQLVEMHHDHAPLLRQAIPVLLLLGTITWAGTWLAIPPEGRIVVTRMDQLLQAAVPRMGTGPDFPEEFNSLSSQRKLDVGTGKYELEWTKLNLNRWGIARYGAGTPDESAVIAHFSGGWQVVCIFPTPAKFPACQDFDN